MRAPESDDLDPSQPVPPWVWDRFGEKLVLETYRRMVCGADPPLQEQFTTDEPYRDEDPDIDPYPWETEKCRS